MLRISAALDAGKQRSSGVPSTATVADAVNMFVSKGISAVPIIDENRAVLGWTIQSEAQAEKLRPWVDNVIFENFRPRKTAE